MNNQRNQISIPEKIGKDEELLERAVRVLVEVTNKYEVKIFNEKSSDLPSGQQRGTSQRRHLT